MFTGLIEDVGLVKNIFSSQIEITTSLKDIVKGDSIAVNGVCLTTVVVKVDGFVADYSPYTDKNTMLSKLENGSKVNLERALRFSSRLGGHIVSGHVDGTVRIKNIKKINNFYQILFNCKEMLLKYIVEKGSVAIDGVSLTVSSVHDFGFGVFIIPETFENTIFNFKKNDDEANIEVDILSKYVEKFINKNSNNLTIKMLKGNGFI
ncbi:MAG: riboflavin synthase [Endomicrobium sp.]|jgi:riboflavin synthase|nr:riboflavin synthase [Endomicrobium sp.]